MVSDSSLFIGTNIYGSVNLDSGGVYRSDDSGRTWKHVGLKRRIIQRLAVSGRSLCAIATDSYYGDRLLQCSRDNGETWTNIAGMNQDAAIGIAFADNRLFACLSKNGLAYTDDMGATWERAGFEKRNISAIAGQGGKIAIAFSDGIFLSSDKGRNWVKHSDGPNNTMVKSFAESQGKLFAGNEGGIFRLEADGINWKKSLPDSLGFVSIGCLESTGSGIFACGSLNDLDQKDHLLTSPDDGNSWNRLDDTAMTSYINDIIGSGSNLLVATGRGLMRSADSGKTWNGPDSSYVSRSVPGPRSGPSASMRATFMPGSLSEGPCHCPFPNCRRWASGNPSTREEMPGTRLVKCGCRWPRSTFHGTAVFSGSMAPRIKALLRLDPMPGGIAYCFLR